MTNSVAAVDLGASSGRVVVARFSPDGVRLREVHRFANTPVRVGGVRRWDVLALFRGILDGLGAGARTAGRLDAVGVDGWGVDYGLLDADGHLLGNPVQYRDAPTRQAVADVLATVGAARLYAATGTQLQPFNTIFQLLAQKDDAQFAIARRALLVPDLMTHWLGGAAGTELTNASTTGLLDPGTMTWAQSIVDDLGARLGPLFGEPATPGRIVGGLRDDLRDEAGLDHAPAVVTVPSHDTAAAVAGVPASGDDFAYVCTGTWALVGLELPGPVITEESRAANFTNEVGVDGTIRFLRNVTGFWLLQECVRAWNSTVDLDALTSAAARIPPLRAVVDVQDAAFADPGDMPRRIMAAAVGSPPGTQAEIVRCILDSMALAIRQAVHDACRLAGRDVSAVHLVGGGVANELFCQLVADATRLPMIAGPTEAASWGNAVTQAQALGLVPGGLPETRALIRRSLHLTTYRPTGTDALWTAAAARLS
jgi:rhamnulokinase